jgi:hypothetical protein
MPLYGLRKEAKSQSIPGRLLFHFAKPMSENHRALQVDQFLDAHFAEYMVTAFHSFSKGSTTHSRILV